MKRSMVFVVTNGAGLGHLTRGLAIAKRVRELEPELEIIFLSTSLGLEVIREEDFMFYYIPTRAIMPEFITPSLWNNYMKSHLREIIQIHQPQAIVFDGAYPYGGVVGNLKMEKNITSFWIKREGYKDDNNKLKNFEALFDYVIVPKEAGKLYGREEDTKRWYCDPVILLNKEEAYPREVLRKAWKVPDEKQIVYVQLGAGNINDINSEMNCVVEGVLKNPEYQILLGESIIGKPLGIHRENVAVIRDYPNSRYFRGIDFAISAVGYNSYHELLYFNVPTLFLPNRKTVKDDQRARARLAHSGGASICLDDVNRETVGEALGYLRSHRTQMARNAQWMMPENGAKQAAAWIIEHMDKKMR